MIKIQPKTKYMGRNVIYLPTCHSTNDFAMELLRNSAIENGCIVITDDQTNGKGQRGNNWLAEPFKNITASLILLKPNIKPSDQFQLNLLFSVGLYKALSKVKDAKLKIKWPNDLFFANKKKLGGVLIESVLQKNLIEASVIGFGININQEQFSMPLATSFKKELGFDIERAEIIESILEQFELNYETFKQRGISEFKESYLQNLFQLEEWCDYEDENGFFKGKILGITDKGELLMEKEFGLMKYQMKEFRYIF